MCGEEQTDETLAQMTSIGVRLDKLKQGEKMYWRKRSGRNGLVVGRQTLPYFTQRKNNVKQGITLRALEIKLAICM